MKMGKDIRKKYYSVSACFFSDHCAQVELEEREEDIIL